MNILPSVQQVPTWFSMKAKEDPSWQVPFIQGRLLVYWHVSLQGDQESQSPQVPVAAK